jgi:hypothetical protein
VAPKCRGGVTKGVPNFSGGVPEGVANISGEVTKVVTNFSGAVAKGVPKCRGKVTKVVTNFSGEVPRGCLTWPSVSRIYICHVYIYISAVHLAPTVHYPPLYMYSYIYISLHMLSRDHVPPRLTP